MARLRCKKCRSSNITLLSNDRNIKSRKTKTSLNLNPFKPFTLFNHKTKEKKKKSAAKLGLGLMTGGVSLLFTGTKDNRNYEFFCNDCGNRWKSK